MKNYTLPTVILFVVILVTFLIFSWSNSTKYENTFTESNDINNEENKSPEAEIKPAKEGSEAIFDVIGTNFEFDVKEMMVKKGDKVVINFINNEGFHDWIIDEFDAATPKIREGNSEKIEFIADKIGEFEYYCSVGNHRAQGMVGKLIITE